MRNALYTELSTLKSLLLRTIPVTKIGDSISYNGGSEKDPIQIVFDFILDPTDELPSVTVRVPRHILNINHHGIEEFRINKDVKLIRELNIKLREGIYDYHLPTPHADKLLITFVRGYYLRTNPIFKSLPLMIIKYIELVFKGVVAMYRMSEVEFVEHQTEDSLYFLRSDENKSQYKIDQHRKVIRNNLAWLRDKAPDSYLLKQDNQDVL